MDKNQAIIDFLIQCPQIHDNPLYFNFSEAEDNNKQIVTVGNDKKLNKTFIDGSELKRYTFTIIDYRSVAYQAIVKQAGFPSENVDEMMDIQSIMDWVTEQNDNMNYPNFGDDCMIDDMRVVTDNPNLNGIDTSVKPAIAKYSFSIQIDYLDKSKMIFN